LRESAYDERAWGFAVRFVVIGTQEEAAAFCGKFGDPGRCIADADKRTYEAMGLSDYNLLRLFTDPELKKRRIENAKAGFKQDWGATKLRNAAQLPGAALFGGDGTVQWMYRGTHPGDLPDMTEMLDVARARVTG
jgi:hypothetical protein